jgi:Zn-dependent alcohol dehydrogenase
LLHGPALLRDGAGGPIHHHLGVSGFARHPVTARESAVVLPPDIPFTTAALFGCAVLTGAGAVLNTAGVQPGQSVGVFGLGGVGLAAVEGRTLVGSCMGSAAAQRDIPRLIRLWRAGRLPVEKLQTAVLGLEEVNEALENLATGQAIRQILLPVR